MPQGPLSDTRFYVNGLGATVGDALGHYLSERGAEISELARLEDFNPPEDGENVLVVHYPDSPGLRQNLPRIKSKHTLRILLLHEFTERGKIEREVLAATDHILEKPFTRAAVEKALAGFRFHPLQGKTIFLYAGEAAGTEEQLLKILGATVLKKLPDGPARLPVELAVFCPENLAAGFREALKSFRELYADVPIFMLYDPQAPGVLDSAMLAEIAYLVQKPISRRVLRQKFLDFFEQPQKDRRKNPRKKGISQMWVSAFNLALGAPEVFESPYLIDISQSGLSFQTYVEYDEGQLMVIWIISEDYPDKIIDLRGHIRWKRRESEAAQSTAGAFKYGLEFAKQDSDAYSNFARMIAMH